MKRFKTDGKEVDLYFYHSKSAINTISKEAANYQKASVSSVKKIKSKTLNELLDISKFKNIKTLLFSRQVLVLERDGTFSTLFVFQEDHPKLSPRKLEADWIKIGMKTWRKVGTFVN